MAKLPDIPFGASTPSAVREDISAPARIAASRNQIARAATGAATKVAAGVERFKKNQETTAIAEAKQAWAAAKREFDEDRALNPLDEDNNPRAFTIRPDAQDAILKFGVGNIDNIKNPRVREKVQEALLEEQEVWASRKVIGAEPEIKKFHLFRNMEGLKEARESGDWETARSRLDALKDTKSITQDKYRAMVNDLNSERLAANVDDAIAGAVTEDELAGIDVSKLTRKQQGAAAKAKRKQRLNIVGNDFGREISAAARTSPFAAVRLGDKIISKELKKQVGDEDFRQDTLRVYNDILAEHRARVRGIKSRAKGASAANQPPAGFNQPELTPNKANQKYIDTMIGEAADALDIPQGSTREQTILNGQVGAVAAKVAEQKGYVAAPLFDALRATQIGGSPEDALNGVLMWKQIQENRGKFSAPLVVGTASKETSAADAKAYREFVQLYDAYGGGRQAIELAQQVTRQGGSLMDEAGEAQVRQGLKEFSQDDGQLAREHLAVVLDIDEDEVTPSMVANTLRIADTSAKAMRTPAEAIAFASGRVAETFGQGLTLDGEESFSANPVAPQLVGKTEGGWVISRIKLADTKMLETLGVTKDEILNKTLDPVPNDPKAGILTYTTIDGANASLVVPLDPDETAQGKRLKQVKEIRAENLEIKQAAAVEAAELGRSVTYITKEVPAVTNRFEFEDEGVIDRRAFDLGGTKAKGGVAHSYTLEQQLEEDEDRFRRRFNLSESIGGA